MKWKNVFISMAFVGAFSLGAMFSPIDQLSASTNDQTPAAAAIPSADNASICPVSGAEMGTGMMGKFFSGTMHETIASELGMSAEELHTARIEGKSIAELAEEKGLDVNTLSEKILANRKAHLQSLVKDGKMTEEQMKLMLENMEARIKTMLERKNYGPMNGYRGGMGKGMKQGRGHHQGMWNSL